MSRKRSLEEMLQDPAPLQRMTNASSEKKNRSSSSGQGKGERKRSFTREEHRRLIFLWILFVVCLVGLILSIIAVVQHNPWNSVSMKIPMQQFLEFKTVQLI